MHYNSPVILTYTFLCVSILGLEMIQPGYQVIPFFTVSSHMDPARPLDYFKLFSHAMGHSGWDHLIGNFTFILLLGPILEEKYGSNNLLSMLFVTALVTGIINILFFFHGVIRSKWRCIYVDSIEFCN